MPRWPSYWTARKWALLQGQDPGSEDGLLMSNPFDEILQGLKTPTRACLRAVYLGLGASVSDIEAASQAGPMQPHLLRLLESGLIVYQDRALGSDLDRTRGA